MRLLAVSDIQGNWHAFEKAYAEEAERGRAPDAIIHTGNLGLWSTGSVVATNDLGYIKQVVAFSSVLPLDLVSKINNLSTIGGDGQTNPEELSEICSLLKDTQLSNYHQYSKDGPNRLPCPVYSVYGPLDHPNVVQGISSGSIEIPYLHLVDHTRIYKLQDASTGTTIKLYGLGGSVKIHSLFDHGPITGEYDIPTVCGKIGELWITLVQIAQFYSTVMAGDQEVSNSINIFMSHAPVIKTPLLEHLAIITHADFTISQGLHFRYPVSGNGMSFVDSMGGSAGYIENYRSKFSRLRMIFGELWMIVRDDVCNHVDGQLRQLLELGLSLFDKIPVSITDNIDEIVPLGFNESALDDLGAKSLLKRINDYYFQAYYNLWHFNVCDAVVEDRTQLNVMGFKLDENLNFQLEHCSSQGFNFRSKLGQTRASPPPQSAPDTDERRKHRGSRNRQRRQR